jgi:hypothetical protein
MVLLDERRRDLAIAELMGKVVDFVIEHIRKPLEEDQRQNVVLEFGGIDWATDHTQGLPQPGFQHGNIELVTHEILRSLISNHVDSHLVGRKFTGSSALRHNPEVVPNMS